MPKLSKTAAAAMKAVEISENKGKRDPFDTNEKKIAELRIQRQAHLAINRHDFVDALLEEYDKLLGELKNMRTAAMIKPEVEIGTDNSVQN